MPTPALGRRALVGVAAALSLAGVAPAGAEDLAKPADKPILTISGKIGRTKEGGRVTFDRTQLESLGMASITTSTPWHDHPVLFEGVPMRRLLSEVAANGSKIKVVALDDYVAELPTADFAKYGTLLALKIGGEYPDGGAKGTELHHLSFRSVPGIAQRHLLRSRGLPGGLDRGHLSGRSPARGMLDRLSALLGRPVWRMAPVVVIACCAIAALLVSTRLLRDQREIEGGPALQRHLGRLPGADLVAAAANGVDGARHARRRRPRRGAAAPSDPGQRPSDDGDRRGPPRAGRA